MARKRVGERKKKLERGIVQPQAAKPVRALLFARLHTYAPTLVLIFLPTFLLWSVTFGGKTLAPVDLLLVMSPWRHFAAEKFPEFHAVKAPLLDVVQQYFPWRKFYAESLRQGELPLWNPFMFCGTSFVGNGMSAIFYPLNLLFVALPVETAFGWVAWLHLVLVGVFMFGFLRQFVSPISALTGAVAFQLCGFFIAWLAYLPLICAAVWLPAALWAFEAGRKARDTGREVTFALLAGIALGMALLAGHPQVGFYVLWGFGLYAFLKVVGDWVLGTEGWKRTAVFGLLTILSGVAFGAPQLLPLTEMAKISFRSEAEAIAAAAANRLPFDQFVRLFVPSFFGDWRSGTHLLWDFGRFNFVERTGYPSVVAFLLAVVGAFSFGLKILPNLKKERLARQEPRPPEELVPCFVSLVPLTAGIAFALIGLLAASAPVVHRFMAFGLPGTQAFVGISRALFLFDFGVAILCSFGVEALAQQEFRHPEKTFTQHSTRITLLSIAVGLVFMAICVSYGITAHAETAFYPLLHDFTVQQIYRWLIFTGLGVFAIFFASRLHAYAPARLYAFRVALYALPILVAVDLLVFAWGQNPEADKAMAFFETPSIRWLRQNLGTQRFIAVGTDAVKHWTPSNTLMAYGLRDAQGSDSLMTMRIFRFLQTWDRNSPLHRAFAVRNFNSPLLDLMSVKYVVAAEPLSADERKNLLLVHAGDLWIYENPDALPRAFALSSWIWAKSPQASLRQIRSPNLDLRKTAVLETPQPIFRTQKLTPHPSSLAPRPVHFSDQTNMLRTEVDLHQPAALVVADGFYPGWLAFGRETGQEAQNREWRKLPILIADYAFKAVLLPKGKWQVVWIYYPSSVAVGLFLCLASVATIVAVAIFASVKGSQLN